MVVVDQCDLAVAHIDVARHLDKWRFGRGHYAERVADRAAVARDHPEEEICRAWLIALEDCLGQQIKGLVLTNLVSIEQHCNSLR